MMQDDTEMREMSWRDLGRLAYNNGDSFDDNPFSVDTFEHEMWADGFESQRELCEWCERNNGDFLDWETPDDCYDSIDSE